MDRQYLLSRRRLLRGAAGVSHVVLDSVTDRPWSDYLCCVAVGNRSWMETHPIVAKRALRAVMKGADVVAADPDGTARFMANKGFTTNFDYARPILRKIPYDIWRDFDPLDSVRFYALRMKESGMIESAPEEIIKKGTDSATWRS